jgi:hypothetical protein
MYFGLRRAEFRPPIIECANVEGTDGLLKTCPFAVGPECWRALMHKEQRCAPIPVIRLEYCPLWDGTHHFRKIPKREFVEGIRAEIPKSIPVDLNSTVWGGPC